MLGIGISPNSQAARSRPNYATQAIAIALAAGGALYDPSDLTSLFQDTAATVPVTASGQPVRLMRDKSGNGKHAVAPSDAARPVLTSETLNGVTYWYLASDGTDDWMNVTPTLNLGEAWWHVGGWRADATGKYYFATSDVTTTRSALRVNSTTALTWYNSASAITALINSASNTIPHVVTVEQASTTLISGRYNRTDKQSFVPYDDSASVQGLALFTGRNSVFNGGFTGRFYGGVFGTGALSTANRDTLERYMSQKTGVAL